MKPIETMYDGEKILIPDELKRFGRPTKVLIYIDDGTPQASFGKGPHRMQDVLPAKGSGRTGAEIDAELRAMRDEWDQ